MLKDQIENALNESRILALVAEVMLGFEYQAVFQPVFQRLPPVVQNLRLIGLGCMLVALALFLSPAAYHQIVESGRLRENLNRFISKATTVGLMPFAVAMGLDFHTICTRILAPPFAIVASVLLVLMALFFWFGLETIVVCREGRGKESRAMESEKTDLKDRIKFVLMEARVVLPGVQALLGFQFAAVLTDSFERMSSTLKLVHLASLLCVAVCTILVMTPAAYHRIVERGQDTDRMETFSRRMVLASMALLAPGIAGDVLVVTAQVTRSLGGACIAAGLTLVAFYSFWFGYMFYLRAQSASGEQRTSSASPMTGE